jgi:hypothetical protein
VRPAALLCILLLALASSGCGGDEPAPAPDGAVALELSTPADAAVVEGEEVEITGRVVPAAARVEVLGREAEVDRGRFRARVGLEEGANVIDVAASAAGRRPASTALRVVREVPIVVPDVEGDGQAEAVERIEGLGLRAELTRGGGLLDGLLPGEAAVCATDPGPGTRVRAGTTVTLEVAKAC